MYVVPEIRLKEYPSTRKYRDHDPIDGETIKVVSGDAVIINGEKHYLASVYAPQIARPRCMDEVGKGLMAAGRLRLLLKGPIMVRPAISLDLKRIPAVHLSSNNEDVGFRLVKEGLAVYSGRAANSEENLTYWCRSS